MAPGPKGHTGAEMSELVAPSQLPSPDPASAGGRQIGPIGTAARAVGGIALTALPMATQRIEPADIPAALIVFPVVAIAVHRLLAAPYERYAPRGDAWTRSRTWLINVSVLALVLGIAVASTYVTPIDGGAIWLFFGVSMLVAAFRGDAGCEVLAFANLAGGHRDSTGCVVFAPVDWVDIRLGGPAGARSRQGVRGEKPDL